MAPQPFACDFFVSRRGAVAAVAQEVAGVLEAVDYSVRVQDYDFALGGRFVLDIHEALKQARHLLILHTEDYDNSFWTRQEFANFLAAAAGSGGERRVGLLRCDTSTPLGLFHGITFGDLAGVEDPAERRCIILKVARGEPTGARPAPRVFGGAIPPENLLFTGRKELLRALHAALSAEGGTAALTQAAVHGLGGVGKTSAARAYVARHGHDYAGVWWIAAAERTGILAGLDALARALDPAMPADTKLDDAAHAALKRIERGAAPLLLVYDNAPAPDALEGLLPARGARVLVTSRWQDWGGRAEELPVAEMDEDEASAFLLRRAGSQDEPGARRLARALGRLPLALDHAGAYVRRTFTAFDDYARQVEALLDTAPRGADYPRSVAATFTLAVDEAAKQSPAAEALLALFAWLAPERIPLLLVDEGAMPAPERAAGLEALGSVSLVTPGPAAEGGGLAVSVHRLVQAVMRARLAARGEAEAAQAAALDRLAAAFPGDAYSNPSRWPLCRALMPHVEALLALLGVDHASAALGDLLNRADTFLDGQGAPREAEAYSRRALEVRERVLGPEHPDTLTSLNNLALCLRARGDTSSAAETLLRRALAGRERLLGPEHPHTLISLITLADCLRARGDSAAAEPLLRRALATSERVLGPEHPHTLASVNNLALCLQARGDAAAAEPLFRRALAGAERVRGPEHLETLTCLDNLAACLRRQGDVAAAEPLTRRALAARERLLGPEHPDTIESLNHLAACLRARGDAAAAEPLFRRALAGAERVLGSEHPTTGMIRRNLALLLRRDQP